MLIGEVVDKQGSTEDFIGHAGNDNYVLITAPDKVDAIHKAIEVRFNEEVMGHYSFIDREQKGIKIDDGKDKKKMTELMSLAVGIVTSEQSFSDIREITEAAAEDRRKRQAADSKVDA